MVYRIALALLFVTSLAFAGPAGEAGRYIGTDEYLTNVFSDEVPAASTLWIAGELRDDVERMLGHRFASLRVRYWFDGDRSAWVLDEIGKELPITIGVSVANGAVENVRVLEFRESRGWEVRYPFFTAQFVDARLGSDERLDRRIDGGLRRAALRESALPRVPRRERGP